MRLHVTCRLGRRSSIPAVVRRPFLLLPLLGRCRCLIWCQLPFVSSCFIAEGGRRMRRSEESSWEEFSLAIERSFARDRKNDCSPPVALLRWSGLVLYSYGTCLLVRLPVFNSTDCTFCNCKRVILLWWVCSSLREHACGAYVVDYCRCLSCEAATSSPCV